MSKIQTIAFTAGTGRAGTTSLASFLNENVAACIAEHEAPPITPVNADGKLQNLKRLILRQPKYTFEHQGFGEALAWYDQRDPRLDRIIQERSDRIRRMECSIYVEANHSFLKSTCDGLITEFPLLKVIHLSRDPLEVAKSFSNRLSPSDPEFHRWNPLPQFKRNCFPMNDRDLTTFQRYLWMWCEVELRFHRFTQNYPQVPVFKLQTPQLKDEGTMGDLVRFLGGELKNNRPPRAQQKNTNATPTEVCDDEIEQAKSFFSQIPKELLNLLGTSNDLIAAYINR